MIVTVTAHPSLDRTVMLADSLRSGDVQQALAAREDAGGKGVNVSRAIAAAGHPTLAVLPLAPTDPYHAALRQTDVRVRAVPVGGAARSNIALTDPTGTTTKVNLPGARLTSGERNALIDAVVAAGSDADWLVLAGSLPPGLDEDFYVDVIRAVRRGPHPPRIAVDTSGAALRAVVADGRPDLIKPNESELADLAGVMLPASAATAADLIAAVVEIGARLVPDQVGSALVTLGSEGAVLLSAEGAWHASAPPVAPVSTVGAGDSALAGYLLADVAGAVAPERLRRAIAYGAAAVTLPGTQIPAPADLPPAVAAPTPLIAERPNPAGIVP
jgi:1-phosphofructokinase